MLLWKIFLETQWSHKPTRASFQIWGHYLYNCEFYETFSKTMSCVFLENPNKRLIKLIYDPLHAVASCLARQTAPFSLDEPFTSSIWYET